MKLLFALTLSLLAGSNTFAAGDAAAGKALSATCAGCHGVDGISVIPTYPNLAGQKEAYLAAQLEAFKSGQRKNGNGAIMAPMAAGLTAQGIKDLAAYYSQLGK